ncbi:MAG: HD domain-containing protein [Anaerolineales bacterium]|nr:HD domain-containing protein [Anaerolineales bacterium]
MMENSINPVNKIEEALVLASHLHAGQSRKGNHIPYLSHLMAVAALVMEDGGSEEEVIAALLHDSIEDSGGLETYQTIESLFGKKTAKIVMECSDTVIFPKPPWQERKENYIHSMESAPLPAVRVSLADKLHNARMILRDLQEGRPDLWEIFNGGKDGTLWYYNSLCEIFKTRLPGWMSDELERVVSEIEIFE